MHSECSARGARFARPTAVIAAVIATMTAAPLGVGCSPPPPTDDAPAAGADDRAMVAEPVVDGAPTGPSDITAWPTTGSPCRPSSGTSTWTASVTH